jgi:hypothetical protein
MSFALLDKDKAAVYKHGYVVLVEPKRPAKTRSRFSAKTEKQIVNPVFARMVAYTNGDPYWKEKMEKWSTGKICPKYRYTNGTLTFSRNGTKSNNAAHKLDLLGISRVDDDYFRESDDEDGDTTSYFNIPLCFQELKKFMTLCTGDMSDKDRQRNMDRESCLQMHILSKRKPVTTLKSILGKPDKYLNLIDSFVLRETDSVSDMKHLSDIVKLIISTKNLDMIEYDESTQTITGLRGVTLMKSGYYTANLPKIKMSAKARLKAMMTCSQIESFARNRMDSEFDGTTIDDTTICESVQAATDYDSDSETVFSMAPECEWDQKDQIGGCIAFDKFLLKSKTSLVGQRILH